MSDRVKRAIVYMVGAIATALGILFGLSSCNVSRVVTTSSQYVTKGDTVSQITVKTIEQYNAERKK